MFRNKTALILGSVGLISVAGCGFSASPSVHHTTKKSHSATTAPTTQSSVHGTNIQWFRLPLHSRFSSPTLIRRIIPSSNGVILDLASYSNAQSIVQPVAHTAWWSPGKSLSTSNIPKPTSLPPSSAYHLINTQSAQITPLLKNSVTGQTIKWPSAIAVYQSGQNPAANPFTIDNQVIGQSGDWIWVTLKGPSKPAHDLLAGVWGYRYWNRLVAFNLHTRKYRIFALPHVESEALTYPLWSHAPAFTLEAHHVYVGIGDWVGVFPTNPLSVQGTPITYGMQSHRSTGRTSRALKILNDASWNAVNADAQFWNCYVMKDPSSQACPSGHGIPSSTALSLSPTYFNHGSVGFPILWASQLPMPVKDRGIRKHSITRLQQALRASLEMAWVGNPSAKALRAKYPSGPPHHLPGYYRKNGLYWAKSPG